MGAVSQRRACSVQGELANAHLHSERGYTLVELLVVLVVLGLMLGLAAISSQPDPRAVLIRDAERLQTLFTLASEEAQLRARPIAWKWNDDGYSFFLRAPDGWKLMDNDQEFKARSWESGVVQVTLSSNTSRLIQMEAGSPPTQVLEFRRDGIDAPFTVTLIANEFTVYLKSDVLGRYVVAMPEN